jgi:hypothetical protein
MINVSNLPGIWRLLFHCEDGLVEVSREFHFELLDPESDGGENWVRTTSLPDFIEHFSKSEGFQTLPLIHDDSISTDYTYAQWNDDNILIALPASSFIQAIEEGSECYRHYQNITLN